MTEVLKTRKAPARASKSPRNVPSHVNPVSSAEPPAAKVTAADAFSAAEKIIRKGRKLDMVALASELGIGRATLYRWTGDRERLIKDVLAVYLRETFDWIDSLLATEKIEGGERVFRLVEEMMRTLTKSTPVKGLLQNEPDVGLRILTGAGAHSLQSATIEKLTVTIQQEVAKGNYQPRLEPHLLAYTVVRLVDSFVYGDIIANIEVDIDKAKTVIRSLF